MVSVQQLKDFKQGVKNFIDSKQTGDDFLKLFMIYEETRNKDVKVSDIIKALEDQTKTEISDELFVLF